MAEEMSLVAGFILVHLFAGKLRFLEGIPRSRWLSVAGGASVAYVFLHLFPELEQARATLADTNADGAVIEHGINLIALAGLVAFYSVERIVKGSQQESDTSPGPDGGPSTVTDPVFRLHMVSFALYNGVVGYLLVDGHFTGLADQLAFFTAMALHFVVNDYGLREDHKDIYDLYGRWILAAAVLAGWVAAYLLPGNEIFIRLLFAFLAGGVILNVMKEELPRERQSRLPAFIAGAFGYALLLLAM